jgi:hypothetical protein
MKKNTKKMIAPIVVAVVSGLYYAGIIAGIARDIIALPPAIKVIALAAPVVVIGISVYVLIERIKEIRSGEEDDLSKY